MRSSYHWLIGALTALSVLTTGCGRGKVAPKHEPPAKVEPVAESQLNRVVLTALAEERLGLATAAVVERSVPRLRSFGGEVTLPASATVVVSAPVSGILQAIPDHDLPQIGVVVKKGQAMFALVPQALTQAEKVALAQALLLLGQARIDADGQMKQVQVQVEAAKIAFDRSERLFREQAGTKKDADDTLAALQLARKSYDAAVQRKKLVDGVELEAGSVKALVIPAPLEGIVRATYAVPGELVPAGAMLFEIMNVTQAWIKVPVYVGELADVDEGAPATVKNLNDPPGAAGMPIKAIRSPPTAQAHASAVDLYYELPNTEGKYRPGQRLSVLVPLRGQRQQSGLPRSAIVTDIYGGDWVYVQTAPRTYTRQRIQVRYVVGDWAVLAQGPAPGARVVTAGAAEVFGSEFGFGH